MIRHRLLAVGTLTLLCTCLTAFAVYEEYKSGIVWNEPKVIEPGTAGSPPSDAVVLFDGKDMNKWTGGDKWKVADGVVTAAGGSITTVDSFGDCQLHAEFATPAEVTGEGQGRGNSGIYFMEKYEVQVLDSYENKTYFDGQCGSIYKQHPPMVNACRKPGEWQTYDILFTAPKFGPDGKVLKPAAVTVLQNGVVVQNHFELLGGTFYERAPAYEPHAEKGKLHLQFHGNPIRYRNIWIREMQEPTVKG